MKPVAAAGLAAAFALGGCGSSPQPATSPRLPSALVRESRPVGRGPRFQPPARSPVVGPCRGRLGHRVGVHVELFAASRVVIVPAGIGTRPPRATLSGRITRAGCYGDLVTLEPTGLVLVHERSRLRLSDLFRAWGQPLSSARLGPFTGPVRTFVDGKPRGGAPQTIPLTRHAVIVLEVGPYVPPHSSYRFPPGT